MKSILHIINHSPFGSSKLEQCLAWIKPDDAILFIENGVYALQKLENIPSHTKLFFLQADIDTRGLNAAAITHTTMHNAHNIKLINYEAMVALILEYPLNKSW